MLVFRLADVPRTARRLTPPVPLMPEVVAPRVCEKSAPPTGSADVSSAPTSAGVGPPSPQGRRVPSRHALISPATGADETSALPEPTGAGETPAVPGLFTDPVVAPDEDGATPDTLVHWTLRPTLLKAGSAPMRAHIAQVIALYAGMEGRPRAAVEALTPRIEDLLEDYRLARCIARTVESIGYHFVSPPRALALEPAALRALCYQRAQERHAGYVPRARRAAFLADLAAELGATPQEVEADLWADRPGAALLRAGPAPAPVSKDTPDTAPTVESLTPASVTAGYNAAVVSTILAASSWVTLALPATETDALKDLYRYAKGRYVGIDVALRASTPEGEGDQLLLTLYGPGSRALVRGRRVRDTGDRPVARTTPEGDAAGMLAGASDTSLTSGGGAEPPDDSARGELSVPAPGGAPVAAAVARLARRYPGAVREGWTRLLGPDHRLFHVPLDAAALAALSGAVDDLAEGDDGGVIQYDSGVEAGVARAFLAAEAGGRLGVARGWTMEREPRAVIAGDAVFLPDFSFRRGAVEVLCEVIGFYTDDYLTRKQRKLAHLRGRISLLLVVDREREPLFAASGFPIVTYQAGRQISVTDVVQALDAFFDPFERRRARAVRDLAALCAVEGPPLNEEEMCDAIGCAGRTELATVWSDLVAATKARPSPPPHADWALGSAEPRPRGDPEPALPCAGEGSSPSTSGSAATDIEPRAMARRYVPGYGLVSAAVLTEAHAAFTQLLDEAGGSVPLDEALAWCEQAGLARPDDALIAELGGIVVRAGLFGEARVYRPGAEAEDATSAALAVAPSGRGRRRRT